MRNQIILLSTLILFISHQPLGIQSYAGEGILGQTLQIETGIKGLVIKNLECSITGYPTFTISNITDEEITFKLLIKQRIKDEGLIPDFIGSYTLEPNTKENVRLYGNEFSCNIDTTFEFEAI